MKRNKITAVMLSIVMSMSMMMPSFEVMADETSSPSETQKTESTEEKEPKTTEKQTPKKTVKQEPKATEKQVPKETEKKYFKINTNTGAVTVKKKLKKGTYTIKCKVNASGNEEYKGITKTVSFKIKVK